MPLITLDIPLFTIRNGNEIFYTNFASGHESIFPISPKSVLALMPSKYVANLLSFQDIKSLKATPDVVSKYNAGTFHNYNEIILSILEE